MKKQLAGLSAIVMMLVPTMTSFANENIEFTNTNSTESITPKQMNANVNASNVNLRSSPGTSSSVVATLQKGQLVYCYSDPLVSKDGYKWQHVGLPNGKSGWIATTYLTYEG